MVLVVASREERSRSSSSSSSSNSSRMAAGRGGRSSCNNDNSAEHLPLMMMRPRAEEEQDGDDSKDDEHKIGLLAKRRPDGVGFFSRISGAGAAGAVMFALAFAGLVVIFISIQNIRTPRSPTSSSPLALHEDLDETMAGKVESVVIMQEKGLKPDGEREETRGSISGAGAAPASRPNVFFIMIDDLGWNDIGYQSSDLAGITPNLDKLAAAGVKMTNYYSMSICTPARASLMTGRYPIRYGLQYNVIQPAAPWGLPLTEKIFPEYMKDAGYESHMVGKWHLGSYRDIYTPHRRGFDTYLGYLNDKEMYWTHQTWTAQLHGRKFFDFGFGNATGYYDVIDRNVAPLPPVPAVDDDGGDDDGVDADADADDGDDDYDDDDFSTGPTSSSSSSSFDFNGMYSTTIFQKRAMEIVGDKTPYDEEPLFLYLAHQAVHDPLGVPPSDAFTAEEWATLDALGEGSSSPLRLRFAKVLMYLDKTVGELVAYLEEEGWMENSIIAVASDNGGCPEAGGSNHPLRGMKHSYWEGGVKVPAFVYSKSHIPEEAWGTEYNGLMHVTDFLPTLSSAIDLDLIGSFGDLDGVDHWAHITNPNLMASFKSPRTEMLYNFDPYVLWADGDTIIAAEYPLNQGAYRQGKWKFIFNEYCQGYYTFDRLVQSTDYLTNENNTCLGVQSCTYCGRTCSENSSYTDGLFDLETDPREEHNVVDLYPEVVDGIRTRIQEVVNKEYANSSCEGINSDAYHVWAAHDYWAMPWFDYLQELIAANKSTS